MPPCGITYTKSSDFLSKINRVIIFNCRCNVSGRLWRHQWNRFLPTPSPFTGLHMRSNIRHRLILWVIATPANASCQVRILFVFSVSSAHGHKVQNESSKWRVHQSHQSRYHPCDNHVALKKLTCFGYVMWCSIGVGNDLMLGRPKGYWERGRQCRPTWWIHYGINEVWEPVLTVWRRLVRTWRQIIQNVTRCHRDLNSEL